MEFPSLVRLIPSRKVENFTQISRQVATLALGLQRRVMHQRGSKLKECFKIKTKSHKCKRASFNAPKWFSHLGHQEEKVFLFTIKFLPTCESCQLFFQHYFFIYKFSMWMAITIEEVELFTTSIHFRMGLNSRIFKFPILKKSNYS